MNELFGQLKILEFEAKLARKLIERDRLGDMTPEESRRAQKQSPGCDFVIGNFAIKVLNKP